MKSKAEIEVFRKLAVQLEGMLAEFAELSKKKPGDAVNQFKLGLANKLLDTANGIMAIADRPFDDFERFDEDGVPTNSDVVLILSQYKACAVRFFKANVKREFGGDEWWIIGGKKSKLEAPMSYKAFLAG